MKITCIADLHGFYPQLSGGDLLIVAGDLTKRDKPFEYLEFNLWLNRQEYEKKIAIAGNHDNLMVVTEDRDLPRTLCVGADYLFDSETEFEGLKIWGSPWTKAFPGMNPHCKAFTVTTDEELAEKWDLIPDDVDILVTHSPPYGIFDIIEDNESVGSISLRNKAFSLAKLKLFVFGHIHEMGGRIVDLTCMRIVNASHVNEHYKPVNAPVDIEL